MFLLPLTVALLTLQSAPAGEMYRVELLRAAPGRLLDLIDVLQVRANGYGSAAGDEQPFIIRHSQGDHWDLMVVEPGASMSEYFAPDKVEARRSAEAAMASGGQGFGERFQELVAWREETFFSGPPIDEVRDALGEAGFFHIEMFIALPGKGEELHRERLMENDYLRRLGRGENLVFDRISGGAWDMMTLGLYRDLLHYAESGQVPESRQNEAARAAGFGEVSRIGTYLRELISRHNDTLGTAVR